MADDENLVSEVRIDGTDAAISDLNKYGEAGKAAFDNMAAGAAAASDKVKKSSEQIDRSAKQAAAGLTAAGNVDMKFTTEQIAALSAKLGAGIARDVDKFTGSLKNLTTAAARFGQRAGLLVTAVAGIGISFALSARNTAKSVDGINTATDDQLKRQTELNNNSLESQTNSINLASAQRKLLQSFQRGEITYSQYADALQKTIVENREAIRVNKDLKLAQDRTTEANERLKKSADDRKAYTALTDTFGGPLTSSIVAFGRVIESTRKTIVDSFGPSASSLVDIFTASLNANATKISAFFAKAGASLQQFVTENGPAISKALDTLGTAAASVFSGLIAAGPSLLNLFNNIIAPAVAGLVAGFGQLAAGINAVFGTKLTGGAIIAAAALLQISGGLKLLFAVLRTITPILSIVVRLIVTFATGMTPLGIAVRLVAVALAAFLASTDTFQGWLQKGQDAIGQMTTAFIKFLAFIVAIPGRIIAGFSVVWTGIGAGATNVVTQIIAGFTNVLTFFTTLSGSILGVFISMWGTLSEGWTAAVQFATDAWASVVDFFTTLGNSISDVFTSVWNAIKDGFSQAVQSVTSTFQALLQTAQNYLQPIIDLLKSIIGLSGSAGGSTAGASFATGGHVRGAGTSTSDSIPAWLSNNEFVVKAKAVSKYGVGLLRAINSGQFEIPKFANGGLVNALGSLGGTTPRYAFADRAARSTGGGPTTTLNLTLDGQQYNGLMAPADVANRLVVHAQSKKVTSAGRKPTWKN
jgi:CHASE3 domain sensor protein